MKFTDVAVVGMHFREAEGVPAKQIVANMLEGTNLRLLREPDNLHDEYAIKVLYDNQHIGYIEAKSACFISPLWDEAPDLTPTCEVLEFQVRGKNLHPICRIEV